MDVFDPSTGDIIAQAPCCTENEVENAIKAANDAFPGRSNTPVTKLVQVLFQLRNLVAENLDDLTHTLARENGKNWQEAQGDVLKALEAIEVACGATSTMMGEALMNVSNG